MSGAHTRIECLLQRGVLGAKNGQRCRCHQALTDDAAPVAREVMDVGGDAGGVDPVAAVEGHDSQRYHGPVGQLCMAGRHQPQPQVAADMLQQPPAQHQPAHVVDSGSAIWGSKLFSLQDWSL